MTCAQLLQRSLTIALDVPLLLALLLLSMRAGLPQTAVCSTRLNAKRARHLVRRYHKVFWRRPHWRGHARLGCVRSRTVELRLPQGLPTPTGTAPAAPGSGDSR